MLLPEIAIDAVLERGVEHEEAAAPMEVLPRPI